MKEVLTPVRDIEGIGQSIAATLQSRNVEFAEDLLALPESKIIRLLVDLERISENNLRSSFIPQARFLRIEGINGQYAEGLAILGWRSYAGLAFARAQTIVNGLQELVGQIPQAPSVEEVMAWNLAAAKMMMGGSVLVSVKDEQERALNDAEIRINGNGFTVHGTPITVHTNSHGKAFIDGIAPGVRHIRIELDGYRSAVVTVSFKSGSRSSIGVQMQAGPDEPLNVIDEFRGGILPSIPRTSVVVNRRYELDELPEVPVFFIHEIRNDTLELASLWLRKTNDVVEVPYIVVDIADVDGPVAVNSVVVPADGGFRVDSQTRPSEYRTQFVRDRLGGGE